MTNSNIKYSRFLKAQGFNWMKIFTMLRRREIRAASWRAIVPASQAVVRQNIGLRRVTGSQY